MNIFEHIFSLGRTRMKGTRAVKRTKLKKLNVFMNTLAEKFVHSNSTFGSILFKNIKY